MRSLRMTRKQLANLIPADMCGTLDKKPIKKRVSSTGKPGETIAEYHFKLRGWIMERVQPPHAWVGKGKVVPLRNKQGTKPPDYMGCTATGEAIFCEVKEAHGFKMPASRLKKEQREWMNIRPCGCCFVGIYWVDYCAFQIFPYHKEGVYEKRI